MATRPMPAARWRWRSLSRRPDVQPVNIRERIDAFWSGERPDEIPYTIYQNEWRHTADDPAWAAMYANGLGVTWYLRSFEWKLRDVEIVDERYVEDGKPMRRQTQRTPVGEIHATWV